MKKIAITYNIFSYISLFFLLCSSFLGNTAKMVSFIIFAIVSLPSIILRFKINKYIIWQLLFTIFVIASYLWAPKEAIDRTSTLFSFLMVGSASYIMLWSFCVLDNRKKINIVLNIYLASSLFLFFFLLFNGVFNNLLINRLGNSIGLNANEIGVSMAVCALISLYKIISSKGIIKKTIYSVFVAGSIFVVLISGSRTSILIVVLSLIILLLIKGGLKNTIWSFLIIAFLCLILYRLLVGIESLYEIIGYRVESLTRTLLYGDDTLDGSIVLRNYLKTQALNCFVQNPILGAGVNGFHTYLRGVGSEYITYSHCNYTELLANFGLIGLLLFYIPKIYLIVFSFAKKTYKTSKWNLFILCVVIAIMISEYGLVSYSNIHIQFVYVLFFLSLAKKSDEQIAYSNSGMCCYN